MMYTAFEKQTSCAKCGVAFTRKKRSTRFCSYRCSAIDRESRRTRAVSYERTCKLCGEAFKTTTAEKIFCKRACYGRYLGGWPLANGVEDERRKPMRWNRKDKNHNAVVEALEKIGCAVIDTSGVGSGVPDLIVSYEGKWYVMEVKNNENAYGRRGFNPNQRRWVEKQKAHVAIINSPEEAVRYITA